MGDQWLRDYEKSRKNAAQLIRESNSLGSKPEARQAALLRGNFAQLRQEVSNLEKSLMAISQNPQAHGVTRNELTRRGDLIAQLQEQVEQVQDIMRNGARRRIDAAGSAQESSWRDGEAVGRGGGRNGAACTIQEEMGMQDETLDYLAGSVLSLKGMSSGISQEIDVHLKLLVDLEDQTDETTDKIRQQKAKLLQLSEQSPTCGLWMCVCCLIVLLVVLLIFF